MVAPKYTDADLTPEQAREVANRLTEKSLVAWVLGALLGDDTVEKTGREIRQSFSEVVGGQVQVSLYRLRKEGLALPGRRKLFIEPVGPDTYEVYTQRSSTTIETNRSWRL